MISAVKGTRAFSFFFSPNWEYEDFTEVFDLADLPEVADRADTKCFLFKPDLGDGPFVYGLTPVNGDLLARRIWGLEVLTEISLTGRSALLLERDDSLPLYDSMLARYLLIVFWERLQNCMGFTDCLLEGLGPAIFCPPEARCFRVAED